MEFDTEDQVLFQIFVMKSQVERTSSCSMSKDDIMVDYSSVLDREDKKKRFSEELEDKELKESLKLQKLYRQIQRQVHCRGEQDEVSDSLWGKYSDIT